MLSGGDEVGRTQQGNNNGLLSGFATVVDRLGRWTKNAANCSTSYVSSRGWRAAHPVFRSPQFFSRPPRLRMDETCTNIPLARTLPAPKWTEAQVAPGLCGARVPGRVLSGNARDERDCAAACPSR